MNKKGLLAILAAGFWINGSEFFRNEVLVKSVWLEHFQGLGLSFPAAPVNGIIWIVWGFAFATVLHLISRKFDFKNTVTIGWLAGFLLMWLVTWNLLVLPLSILVFAFPLSVLEVVLAVWILRKVHPV